MILQLKNHQLNLQIYCVKGSTDIVDFRVSIIEASVQFFGHPKE